MVLPSSGVLLLKKPLDRERRKRLELTLTARDHGVPSRSASARLVISVSDRNDNSPRFERDAYSFSLEENLPGGTFVGGVVALDKDEGVNGRVQYGFRTPSQEFAIHRSERFLIFFRKKDY